MKEEKLFGALMPTHPDILPSFEVIREKYQIPPSLTDFLKRKPLRLPDSTRHIPFELKILIQ